MWQVIMTIFFLGIISYVLYNGFWRPFYTVYENRPAPLGMLKLIIVFGMMISLIAWYIIPKTARERACELIPLLVWPPVMLAIVSLAAATEAAGVKECKEPFTAIYDGGVNHKPDDSQVCPIMSP